MSLKFYFLVDGPGMSFADGIFGPQAAPLPLLLERTFPSSISFSAFEAAAVG